MANKRKRHSPEFKLKAVIEVLKGEKTANQIAGELGVHPMVLSDWKRHFIEHGPDIFARASKSDSAKQAEKEKTELFEQIGRLKMEVEWLKKVSQFQ